MHSGRAAAHVRVGGDAGEGVGQRRVQRAVRVLERGGHDGGERARAVPPRLHVRAGRKLVEASEKEVPIGLSHGRERQGQRVHEGGDAALRGHVEGQRGTELAERGEVALRVGALAERQHGHEGAQRGVAHGRVVVLQTGRGPAPCHAVLCAPARRVLTAQFAHKPSAAERNTTETILGSQREILAIC